MRLLKLALCAAVAACALLGQDTTGSIAGTVTDPSGAAISGATVTVTNTDRNAVLRTATTDNSGDYVAPLLPNGAYMVSVESKGFKKWSKRGLVLNVNDKLTVNAKLEVGEITVEVTIEADPVQVELLSSTAQALITGEAMTELSLNARNFEQMVGLMPGVTYTDTGDQPFVGVSNPLSGSSNQTRFAINGTRTSQNNWTVDGADNVDRGSNLTILNYPSVDAIAEFRVQRGQYSAEFGRNAGGMVNVITKSGSAKVHGGAYEFFRNDMLSANNYFNNANKTPPYNSDGTAKVPPLRYNNFGWNLGGPVYVPKLYEKKNKTFFFFSQEFRRIITYTTVTGAVVPTADEKQGIFSVPVCTTNTGTTCAATDAVTRITNINPLAAAYIKDIFSKIPDPVQTPGAPANHSLNLSLRNKTNHRQELVKIDHVINSNWSIAGRYIQDSVPTIEPRGLFTAASLPGVSDTSTNAPGKGLNIRLVGNIRPTLLNELGYSYSYGAITSDPIGLDAMKNSPDIQAKLPFPVTLGRVPTLTFGGTIASVTGYGPYRDYNRNHNWFDNLTKIAGKHTIKAGVTIVKYNKQENAAGNNVGSFAFTTTPRPTGGTTTAQAWANFLMGNVSSFTQVARDITPSIHLNQAEGYLQDDIRLRNNLTLNVGVRYSAYRQPTDAGGFLNSFDPSAYNPAKAPGLDANGNFIPNTGDPLNGFIVGGKNSPYGNKVAGENNANFAPRVGFSWDPFSNGKTAIRGGYGYAYDSPSVSYWENVIFNNAPSVQNVTINNTTTANVSGGTVVAASAPSRIYALPSPYKTPYVQQWSLDVQRELGHRQILAVGYYGNKGTHLVGAADINQVPVGAAVAAGIVDANTPVTSATTPKLNLLRPYKGYGPINALETWYNSNYHSIQAQYKKSFASGGFISANYTWSKMLTDAGTDSAAPMNVYNRAADRSLSPYDRKQVAGFNYSYPLPFLKAQKGLMGKTLGGWQLSGVFSAASGLPFAISSSSLGTDPGGLGILGSSPSSPRPDMLCDPNSNAPHAINQWFNTACYADVPKGQVRPGNAARYTVRGPGYWKVDFSLFKNLNLNESGSLKLQLRGETFNALNHTNWSSISTSLGSSTYGTILGARDARVMQLGAKLNF